MQTSQEIINKTESREYSIVRLNKDNLDDVTKLHSEVYADAVAAGHFHKKYNTAYTGVEYVGFIAYNDGKKPVAYYGVIPCFMQYENETILAAQSADTMTHPQHRYKGMFVELSNMTFALCRELEIRLIYGFPNQNSFHGAITKLGWKMTWTMDCFRIPVNSLPLESVSKKIRFLKNLYSRYSQAVLKKSLIPLNGVGNSVIPDGFAGVYRSDEYLNYKTYSSAKVIRVADSKLWVSVKQSLMIGDMEGINEKNFNPVIKKLKRIAMRLGIGEIQFHCSPGINLHTLFSMHYKATPSYPMLFQDFCSAIPPEKIRFTFADIDIF